MNLYEIEKELREVLKLEDKWASEYEGDITDFPLNKELEKLNIGELEKLNIELDLLRLKKFQ